jgi:hypothetical protein
MRKFQENLVRLAPVMKNQVYLCNYAFSHVFAIVHFQQYMLDNHLCGSLGRFVKTAIDNKVVTCSTIAKLTSQR